MESEGYEQLKGGVNMRRNSMVGMESEDERENVERGNAGEYNRKITRKHRKQVERRTYPMKINHNPTLPIPLQQLRPHRPIQPLRHFPRISSLNNLTLMLKIDIKR